MQSVSTPIMLFCCHTAALFTLHPSPFTHTCTWQLASAYSYRREATEATEARDAAEATLFILRAQGSGSSSALVRGPLLLIFLLQGLMLLPILALLPPILPLPPCSLLSSSSLFLPVLPFSFPSSPVPISFKYGVVCLEIHSVHGPASFFIF